MKLCFKYKGLWFLPTDKNNKVNGILTFDINEGCTLELFGGFGEVNYQTRFKNENIIQGITSDSKKITLYKCFFDGAEGLSLTKGDENIVPTTRYTIIYVLEGFHIDNKEDMKFQKMVCEINNLNEWVGISGFSPIQYGSDDLNNFEININYKCPLPIDFSINDKLNGQLHFTENHPVFSNYQNKITISQIVQFRLTSESDYTLEELLKYLFRFQNFLILGFYKYTYPTSIELYGNDFSNDYGDGIPIKEEIKLFFSIQNISNASNYNLDTQMLFGYRNIQEEFCEIIKKWFEKYEKLEPAFNLLLEQFYKGNRFSENSFLNLAQAAETFHSRVNNHTRMPKPAFDKMRAEILALVPKDYHEWLEEQFNFGNNLNLHTRLTQLVSKYSNDFLKSIIKDNELFVKQVKWSRNYYTHYSSDGKKQALKGQELFYLTEKLKILLVCAFLVEVGFDNYKLNKLLERNRYKFFSQLEK